MAKPIISIIISAKNEAERLESCFRALAAQKTKYSFEVHIVDNHSTDGTYRKASLLAKVQKKKNFFVWKQKKPGSPAARNLGARKARGKILLFTDADCQPTPQWVEEMSAPLLEKKNYPLAAVGGRTESLFASNKPNVWEKYLDEIFAFWEQDRISAFPAFLPWAPTCNLAVRADIFHGLGGFDENWRTAAYDVDLCWRIVLCGFTMGYTPKAEVKHLRRGSLRSLLRQMENYAYYNYALLRTYERLLKLPLLSTRRARLESKTRRVLHKAFSIQELVRLRTRTIDLLVALSAFKGSLEAQVSYPKANPLLHKTRKGEAPTPIKRILTRGFSHLHKEGWVHWKDPADVQEEGDLILFHPRKRSWYRLNDSAWTVWEVKSEGGQSQDAAAALGQEENDTVILKEIDELSFELHKRRLLP